MLLVLHCWPGVGGTSLCIMMLSGTERLLWAMLFTPRFVWLFAKMFNTSGVTGELKGDTTDREALERLVPAPVPLKFL